MTTDVDHLAELDDPNDPDSDYGRGYQAALDAVLAALRNEAEQRLARAHDLPERAYARGIAYSSYFLEPWLREGAGIVRHLAATTPPTRPSATEPAENAPAVGREAASPTAVCGHDLEAFERQAAELAKLRVQVQAGACPHTEAIGELHLKWLAEVADLKQRILDIDAHATPYGDIPDEPGWVGTYLVTAGALHRALGKVGHSAPKCQAEAERDRLEAERDEAHALMVQARAERDRPKSPIGQVVITPAAQSAGIPPQVVVDELWRAGWRPPGGTR